MKIVDRPRCVSVNRRWVWRLRSAPAGMSILRSTSPGARMFSWLPVTKSTASTVRSDPSVAQQRVGGLERDGHRDHRSRGQRHADVAADRRGVPHLERRQEGLAAGARTAARLASRPGATNAYRSRIGAHRADLEPGVAGDQRVPAERHQVDQPAQIRLLIGEQPGSAGQPRVARRASRCPAAQEAAERLR